MKFFNFLIVLFLLLNNIQNKSFLDLAQEEVFKYDSENYRKEPASLNPSYYSEKGAEELDHCRNNFQANYNRCSQFKTCNFCGANSECAWCDEKKICLPIDLNAHNDYLEPLCQGDCIRILKIEYCFKGLFEPENNPGEINFSTYEELNKEDGGDENGIQENILERTLEKNMKINNHNLDYDPNAYTNKPNSVNLEQHHKELVNDMTNISKRVFSNLVDKNVSDKEIETIKPNLTDKREDMMKYMKEYIPNFEFPQYVKSDLEDSIDKIKKEKLLLWLRGYSLNEKKSKTHLPIYQNLTFVDEEPVRKMFLDKFYKDVVKDPYKDINSMVYKNLMGGGTLFGDKIPLDKYKKKEKVIFNEMHQPGSHIQEKITNSKFIQKDDLKSFVKKNNMRFKELNKNNKLKSKTTSFKELADELKDLIN
jgi:hypothetical protein